MRISTNYLRKREIRPAGEGRGIGSDQDTFEICETQKNTMQGFEPITVSPSKLVGQGIFIPCNGTEKLYGNDIRPRPKDRLAHER